MGAPCQDTVQDLDSASTAECALTACMQTNMFDDSMMIQQSTKACSARSMARPRAAALDTVSSYSASGTESATRPAPACMPKQLLTVELEMAGSIVCKLWLGLQTINVCSSCMQYDALLYYTGMIVSRLAGDTHHPSLCCLCICDCTVTLALSCIHTHFSRAAMTLPVGAPSTSSWLWGLRCCCCHLSWRVVGGWG